MRPAAERHCCPMIYTVVKIEEDMDFGCEERSPGSPVMAVLALRDKKGNIINIRYPDKELYDLDINAGDLVFYETGKDLEKVDGEQYGSDREYGQTEIRNPRDVLSLIEAFAVVALIIGIIISAAAEDYTVTDDAGKATVVVSFIVAALCQICIWIINKKNRGERK